MVRPNDYKCHHGCWDCSHVFVQYDYGGEILWCTYGAANSRPLCGEINNNEVWPQSTESAIRDYAAWMQSPRGRASDAWDTWSEGREVSREGKCKMWNLAHERT